MITKPKMPRVLLKHPYQEDKTPDTKKKLLSGTVKATMNIL